MLYWTIQPSAPLRDAPSKGRQILAMPFGALVETTGEKTTALLSGQPTEWLEVIYTGKTYSKRGWVYAEYLERYVNEFAGDVVNIPYPTSDPTDAAQYMVWLGNTQFNLCGELCVCYIVGDGLDVFLSKWQAKAINIFKRVFADGRSRGTSITELDSMLWVYDFPASLRLDTGLRDDVLKRPLISPGRLAQMLETYRGIVGVKISGTTGNLQSAGILHWVVLEKVVPDGINRGWVEIYNPFHNRIQRYSWNEFVLSMGAPYGLWVKR